MRINIVAFDNGVGNSRDVVLMREAVAAAGHSVDITSVSLRARRLRRSPLLRAASALRHRLGSPRRSAPLRYDRNLMLEHIWPAALHLARRTIVVPNPEWFDRADLAALPLVDTVWTKTRYAQELFSARKESCQFVGFDSVDRLQPEVPRSDRFLHLAGKSRMKGTARLLQLWRQHPEWPELTVIYSRAGVFEALPAPNIRYLDDYLSDAQLLELQNAHRFHICTSETEGWGHYIPEALSTGAITLVTDAPPMNELVTAARGLLIASRPVGTQHLATLHEFSAADLERQVDRAIAMTTDERQRLGAAARDWYVHNRQQFRGRVAAALA